MVEMAPKMSIQRFQRERELTNPMGKGNNSFSKRRENKRKYSRKKDER